MTEDGIERVDRTFSSPTQKGHLYRNILGSGNSRIHAGDSYTTQVHHHHYYCPSAEPCDVVLLADNRQSDNTRSRGLKRIAAYQGQGLNITDRIQLEKALYSLSELSTADGHGATTTETAKAAMRMADVLDAMRYSRTDCRSGHADDELDRLKLKALLARRVVLNPATQNIVKMSKLKVDRAIWKRDTMRFRHWIVTLMTRQREYRDESGSEVIESLSRLQIEVSDRDKILVSPIDAFFSSSERSDFSQTSFIPPIVFAYRLVDADSEVFHALQMDDVDSLKKLLYDRKATLRDCNSDDESLLSVSLLGGRQDSTC